MIVSQLWLNDDTVLNFKKTLDKINENRNDKISIEFPL